MRVNFLEMHSWRDLIRSMYMSKRHWDCDKEHELEEICRKSTDHSGRIKEDAPEEFWSEVNKALAIGQKHTTLLRMLDISVYVQGLHRGAMDDFDSHAKRLESRIIRSSTRLGFFDPEEQSDWYRGKILTLGMAEVVTGTFLPKSVILGENEYIRVGGGYVKKGLEKDKDVLRGLLPLSIPCDFTFKCNLTEFAHIYRERGSSANGANGTAAPELQEMVEWIATRLEEWCPTINREYLLSVRQ